MHYHRKDECFYIHVCNRWKKSNHHCCCLGSNPDHLNDEPKLYRLAIKAGLHYKAVQVYHKFIYTYLSLLYTCIPPTYLRIFLESSFQLSVTFCCAGMCSLSLWVPLHWALDVTSEKKINYLYTAAWDQTQAT